MQSIWQFSGELPPPLLHAETWSASISSNLYILPLFASCPTAQSGQLDSFFAFAALVCFFFIVRWTGFAGPPEGWFSR